MQQDDPKPKDEAPQSSEEIEENDPSVEEPKAPEQEEQQELDPWEQLEAEATKWKELSLRTAAEMENLRKRSSREREESIRYANQRLLEELLPVIDNFEMGMQAASEDTSSMIYIGMDMVRKQLSEFLANQGVKEIETEGQFDPNIHDAVSQEVSEKPEGEIIRVTRKGFILRDRLLRPASVVVSAADLPADSES
ncbi:MAG: nucleotide exchange factor GrpE [Akkermansiaceae bacterium]